MVQAKEVHLKEYRKENRILQKEIAAMLDIKERQYRRLEKGDSAPNIWDAIKIADRLGVQDLRLLWSCRST